MANTDTRAARERRHRRVRRKVRGTAERPRLSVFRSLKHIYAQVTDDNRGHTLAASSTLEPEVQAQLRELDKAAQAQVVGQMLAAKAQERGIKKVVFDRGGYKYHGRVKALAEACRQAGLEF